MNRNDNIMPPDRTDNNNNNKKRKRIIAAPQDSNCLRWRNGKKVHKGCRNDHFTHNGYKIPLLYPSAPHMTAAATTTTTTTTTINQHQHQQQQQLFDYLVIDKPCDIVLNVDGKRNVQEHSEWNVIDLLKRDYSHLFLKVPQQQQQQQQQQLSEEQQEQSKQYQQQQQQQQQQLSFKLCHQIDFETSGLCIIATTSECARSLSLAFANKQVEKYYVMMVHGHIDPSLITTTNNNKNNNRNEHDETTTIHNNNHNNNNNNHTWTINTWIKQAKNGTFRSNGKLKQLTSLPSNNDPNDKDNNNDNNNNHHCTMNENDNHHHVYADATSSFILLAHSFYSNKIIDDDTSTDTAGSNKMNHNNKNNVVVDNERMPVSLLGARIYTGRRHQLRLHCRHMNHPIVGDLTYIDKQSPYKPMNAHRTMLHSYSMTLVAQSDTCSGTLHKDQVLSFQTPDFEISQYLLSSEDTMTTATPAAATTATTTTTNSDHNNHQTTTTTTRWFNKSMNPRDWNL